MLIEDIPVVRWGDADTLKVRKHEVDQVVGPDDVAIGVKFSGINFADIQMRIGLYPDAPPRPFVPGYEVSGIVEAVGANVKNVRVGEEVGAGCYFGGYSSRIVVPSFQVFAKPKTLNLEETAASPVTFFTAWTCLFEMAGVKKGDKVCIEPGTGGVGTMAIQMAKHAGCDVVALTTSPSKKDYIRALGAEPYTRDEFDANPGLNEFKMILNASGGSSIKRHMQRLDLSGSVVCIGVNSAIKDGKRNLFRAAWTVMSSPFVPVLTLLNKNQGVFGFNGLTMLQNPKWVARLTERLSMIDEMKLKPHVAKVFPAAEAGKAHRMLESKGATGKVLLSW